MEPIYGLEMNYVRRYWFSCSLFVRQWSNPVQKLNRNHGLEIMICKNHFVSCNELIVMHHASKRTVYSKFKITIDFNYILMAKTAAFKFGEFLVFYYLWCPSWGPCPARPELQEFFFFFIPATLRLDRSTSGSQNLAKVPCAYHLRHLGIKSLPSIILEYLTHGSHASGLSRKQRPFMFTRNRIDKFEKIEEFIWFKVWYFY